MTDPVPFRPYAPGTQPDNNSPAYMGTIKRHPNQAPIKIPHTVTETTGPSFSPQHFPPLADLTMTTGKPALGERIIVAGTITDEAGRPVPHTMI
jgi:protocatechuate 3,4-dioxygenase, beta subunit